MSSDTLLLIDKNSLRVENDRFPNIFSEAIVRYNEIGADFSRRFRRARELGWEILS